MCCCNDAVIPHEADTEKLDDCTMDLIRKEAIPMSAYKVVQTGMNTLLGGVQDGSGISLYQVLVPDMTMGDPRAPPMTVAATHGSAAGMLLRDVVVLTLVRRVWDWIWRSGCVMGRL